jgi:hypothetical protein
MSGNRSGFSEVTEGVFEWSAMHPTIKQPVHSCWLPGPRVAIDPIGAGWLADAIAGQGGLSRIVLSNRHHRRSCEGLAQRFGADIVAPEPGMHEFGTETDIKPYSWGEEVAPGVTAHEIGVICPDDGALHIASGAGALLIADSVIRWDGALSFVPDFLMDDPEETKAGTLKALEPLLDLDWDALLLAHGDPVSSGGKEQLRAFIAEPGTADFSL